VRRYIADASYWIYLAHLPVVAALAVWVGHWPLHLEHQVPVHPGGELRGAVPELSLPGAAHGHRQVAQWSQVPAPTAAAGFRCTGRDPRRAPASAGGGSPWPSCAPSPRNTATTTALAGVDIELRPGELLALLGPNGAGKTTAISLWLGLTEPDAGEVRAARRFADWTSKRGAGSA
jgi:ABC-type multidrug transport system fused ATPase/permease subunit